MKKIPFIFILLVGLVHFISAQDVFINEQYGFAMQVPKDWISTNKAALKGNLTKFDLDDNALAKLLKENDGTFLLAAYSKYDPNIKPGLIPTIQIQVRSKPPSTYEEFEQQLIRSTEQFKNFFEEYETIGKPQRIEISSIRTLFLTSKFNMKMTDGQTLKVRSRIYAIPLKTYFFQLNFTDGFEEDCSSEFDNLVKTIKIGRTTSEN